MSTQYRKFDIKNIPISNKKCNMFESVIEHDSLPGKFESMSNDI